MEEIMQSNSFFIIPLTIAYATICALWFLLNRKGLLWDIEPIQSSNKPKLDLGLSLLASVTVILIGQLYSAGFLIPNTANKTINQLLIWPLNNVVIFSPIFVVLFYRKQGLETIFIARNDIFKKILFGFVAALLGISIFSGLRGEWDSIPMIIQRSYSQQAIANFPATFFENIALAFLFVRLKWVVGIKWAIGIPAVIFALAHVPGSIAEGDSISHILTFFFLTGGLTVMILYTAYRSRDILWLGVVHFMMDIAIKAF